MGLSSEDIGKLNGMNPVAQDVGLGFEIDNAGGVSTGKVIYVDGNRLANGDGTNWENAYNDLPSALADSHADIADGTQRGWADRNKIYVKADAFTADLTLLAQKTDVIGVGSYDANTQPGLIGNHVIDGTNYAGCRFFNFRFSEVDSGAMWTVPTTQSGLGFIGCTFDGRVNTPTHGIISTASYMLHVIGCRFIGPVDTTFTTACIELAAGASDDNIFIGNEMHGGLGIVINASTTTPAGNIVIRDNFIDAKTLCVDDNSDLAAMVNNRFVSVAADGGVTAPGCMDGNIFRAVGNVLAGNDSNGPWPNLDAHS